MEVTTPQYNTEFPLPKMASGPCAASADYSGEPPQRVGSPFFVQLACSAHFTAAVRGALFTRLFFAAHACSLGSRSSRDLPSYSPHTSIPHTFRTLAEVMQHAHKLSQARAALVPLVTTSVSWKHILVNADVNGLGGNGVNNSILEPGASLSCSWEKTTTFFRKKGGISAASALRVPKITRCRRGSVFKAWKPKNRR